MKVEVTLYNTNGEEIDGEVIDVGDRIDVNDPPDWPADVGNEDDLKMSEQIHNVIKPWLLFPGFHITITVPKE